MHVCTYHGVQMVLASTIVQVGTMVRDICYQSQALQSAELRDNFQPCRMDRVTAVTDYEGLLRGLHGTHQTATNMIRYFEPITVSERKCSSSLLLWRHWLLSHFLMTTNMTRNRLTHPMQYCIYVRLRDCDADATTEISLSAILQSSQDLQHQEHSRLT